MKYDILYSIKRHKGEIVFTPIAQHEQLEYLNEGDYRVKVRPGHRTITYDINPEYATVEAAIEEAKDAMAHAMMEASRGKPDRTLLTPSQLKAFEKFKEESGFTFITMKVDCAMDVIEAGLNALRTKIYKKTKEDSA